MLLRYWGIAQHTRAFIHPSDHPHRTHGIFTGPSESGASLGEIFPSHLLKTKTWLDAARHWSQRARRAEDEASPPPVGGEMRAAAVLSPSN